MLPKSKPRVIKDFDKLDKEIQEQVLQMYPNGFAEFLITYTDPKTGMERFALPYETEDRYYMIRMDEYIDTDSAADDDDFSKDDDLINLGLDNMDKPADIKMEEDEDEEEEDDEVSKPTFDDSDDEEDDEDLENIADEESEDENDEA